MAAIFRIGIGKLVNNNCSSKLLSNNSELKVLLRGISGKSLRCSLPLPPKPAPWPYKTKRYNQFHALYDKTTARFDENTKLIVVEGPVAAGKTKFAKELAEELDMLYLPEANLDMLYTNDYGFNLKQLDEEVPESCRSFDVKDFLLNPRHKKAAAFQVQQYVVKFSQYIDALAHVLSTGQGVILDRCVYSDFVFAETMYKHGYISKGARSYYFDARKTSIDELMRPHLVIYLDVPVEKVLAKIKKRNIPAEVNSAALTPEYLQTMENTYKQDYLKNISTHSEILVYDWSEEGEVEIVVEDIERIKFDYDQQDIKMKDWVYHLEEEWAMLRHKYADKKDEVRNNLRIARFDVPELLVGAEDMRQYRLILNSAPGQAYEYGFNPSAGDTGLLFKTSVPRRDTLPLIERSL